MRTLIPLVLCALALAAGAHRPDGREAAIPRDAAKATPETDAHPPVLHVPGFTKPVPLPGPVNTAGAEDSPFVTPDGKTLYWFFTPDVRVPPQRQVTDGVTGVYWTRRSGSAWAPPQRVMLQDAGKLALDGCVCVLGDTMWFGSVRAGNAREIDIWTARLRSGRWTEWRNAGRRLNVDLGMGELHVCDGGDTIYYHSDRPGGAGGRDIWVTRRVNGAWQEPENVRAVNTPEADGYPFVSSDGKELWITRTHRGTPALYRSRKARGAWQTPELVVSQFAGEATLDDAGNLYFVHHYFRDGSMLEADIYWCRPIAPGTGAAGRS